MRVFALELAAFIARACERAPLPLSAEHWGRFLNPSILVDACGRTRPEPDAR